MRTLAMPVRIALLTLLLVAPLALTPTPAAAAEWTVDTVHSDISFSIRHFVSRVPGRFNDFGGTIQYDPAKPTEASVEMTVQAASIDTKNENRDQHLRSADFFDVEKFPTLTFQSTEVKSSGKDKLAVTGDLTMHGVTKRVTIPVTFLGSMETPNGTKAGFHTEFTVDRSDYGIEWNRALEGGGAILGDEVEVEINLEVDLKAMEEETEG